MSKTAHGNALGGYRIGCQRINFEVVTKGIGLIAEVFCGRVAGGGNVPAGEAVIAGRDCVPTLAALGFDSTGQGGGGDTIATARSHGLGITRVGTHGNLEIHGPVFFAGQEGTPWRFAVTAIVDGAAACGATGVEAGAHHGANISHVGGRTCDACWSLGCHTAVQG